MIKFSGRVVSTIQIPMEITEADIESIVVGALEGGSGYWMGVDNTDENWKDKPKGEDGEPVATWATKLLLEGKPVRLYDIDKSETELEKSKDEKEIVDQGYWNLTLNKLLRGVMLNSIERPRNSDKNSWDACDCDCILQYALFGEVVFC